MSSRPHCRLAAVALVAIVGLVACVGGESQKADELGFTRPAAGGRWCQVVPDDAVDALVDAAGRSGTPWQRSSSGDLEWSCTITPDLSGRGLDDAPETPADLLSFDASLMPPRTADTVAAGNHTPVGAGLEDPVTPHGDGVWSAARLGHHFVRRPCPRSGAEGPARPPDELQMQMIVTQPRALEPDRLRDLTVAAWQLAATAYGCTP